MSAILKRKTTPFCRYKGYISAALVLGGVDVTGPHLYSVYPHGSTDSLPYVTMGSGSLAAMAVFEDGFTPEMEVGFDMGQVPLALEFKTMLQKKVSSFKQTNPVVDVIPRFCEVFCI